MSAAVVDSSKVFVHGGMVEQHTVLSALTSAQAEDIAIKYQSGAPYKTAPLDVSFEWLVLPTTGIGQGFHILASDSTSGNTVQVKAIVEVGGNIASAVLKVKIRWLAAARRDGQSTGQDNIIDNG
jgi:hypothetical protein